MPAATASPPSFPVALDVPLVPDDEYIAFLNRHSAHIPACHFSMHALDVADGRHRSAHVPLEELTVLLGRCRVDRKYVLLNARFNAADRYLTPDDVQRLVARLETMLVQDVVTGIVFGDFYLLNALSDHAPSVAGSLEAVPGINFMIDSLEKGLAVLEGIGATHFKLPGKMPLDRALNRDPQKLAAIAGAITGEYADLQIELLANEGCLYQCPFKLTHDSLIALLNTGINVDTLALNRDLGCMRRLNQAPWRILASPFIRPEDVPLVTDHADLIKICGRTLGPAFLMNTITAYLQGRYTGNLFDLLDACHWMARTFELPNHKLPGTFWQQITTCSRNCRSCPTCRSLWERTARAKPMTIAPFRQT